jgi:hypothetical protein
MRDLHLVLSLTAVIVFFSAAWKVSLLLHEQRTTNELLREVLKR